MDIPRELTTVPQPIELYSRPPMPSPAPSTERPRILFMDDEPDICRVGSRVLKHLGYEAEVVTSGAEALQAFAKARADGMPFAAAILDITIPGGMGGLETAQRLRDIDPTFKIILSSGCSSEEVRSKIDDGSCAAALAKPYEIATMAATIKQVLAS